MMTSVSFLWGYPFHGILICSFNSLLDTMQHRLGSSVVPTCWPGWLLAHSQGTNTQLCPVSIPFRLLATSTISSQARKSRKTLSEMLARFRKPSGSRRHDFSRQCRTTTLKSATSASKTATKDLGLSVATKRWLSHGIKLPKYVRVRVTQYCGQVS
jgi:hypothetical protein